MLKQGSLSLSLRDALLALRLHKCCRITVVKNLDDRGLYHYLYSVCKCQFILVIEKVS